MTPEGKVVNALKKAVDELGLGYVRMSLRPGVAVGWPDFIVFGPGGKTLWVETKAPGKEPTKMQLHRRDTLAVFGHLWAKPDNEDAAAMCIEHFARRCVLAEGVRTVGGKRFVREDIVEKMVASGIMTIEAFEESNA